MLDYPRMAHTLGILVLGVLAASCGGGGSAPNQPPAPPPVSVTVTPATAGVVLGATQQFAAAVTGSSNAAVTWLVNGVAGGNADVGTISAAGFYTAPQNLPSPASVTITATSQADASKSANATVTVQSDLTVTVTPDPASVELGATQQFTATVTSAGNPNRAVAWSINGIPGGNAAVGTITSAGLYTAPPNLPVPAALTITATSQADGTKSDAAALQVTSNFTLTLSGPSSLNTGTAGTYTATIVPLPGSNPNPAVTWSVNSVLNGDATVGQICLTGSGVCVAPTGPISAPVEYRAPLVAPANPVITLAATSAADPARQAIALVMLNSIVAVTITPASGVAVVLDGSVQFTATVSGTTDQRVVWDVDGVAGGNQATTGAISNPPTLTGPATYFAPSQLPGGANTVTVRATSQFDPSKSASVTVQLFSNIAVQAYTGAGANASLRAVNRKEVLCVAISNATNTAHTWTVNGIANGNATVGTIVPQAGVACPAGAAGSVVFQYEYTAPASVPAAPAVTAVATSSADPARASAVTITILAAPTVNVSPGSLTLQTGSTVQLTAAVAGTPVAGVNWDVNGVPNGDATNGQICVPASNPCAAPPVPAVEPVEYRAPAVVPANPAVTVNAMGADGGNGFATITITPPSATQPQITRLIPASVTAGVASPFLLKVLGANFVAGSGSGASVLLFGTPQVAKTTSCVTAVTPHECTATIDAAEVSAAGSFGVQIRNPDTAVSNSVSLVAVADTATEQVISLTPGAPSASGQDIVVVEPLTAGTGAQTLNLSFIGFFINNGCIAQSSPLAIPRPPSGSVTIDLCIGGTGIASTSSFTLSGPGDVTLGVPGPLSLGLVQVRLPVTVSSTALAGARTLFAANANKEKTAATGAIEIK